MVRYTALVLALDYYVAAKMDFDPNYYDLNQLWLLVLPEEHYMRYQWMSVGRRQ